MSTSAHFSTSSPESTRTLEHALDSGLLAQEFSLESLQSPQPLESLSPAQYCQHFCSKDSMLIERLDLEEFLYSLAGFFARPKGIYLQGDMYVHYALLQEIDSLDSLPALPHIASLSYAFMLLQKQGTLRLTHLADIAKELEFFYTLQQVLLPFPQLRFTQMIEKILIPKTLLSELCIFDERGEIKAGACEVIDGIQAQLASVKSSIKSTLQSLLHKDSLAPYFVDKQIHLLSDTQTLLLKAGYTRVLKGAVLDRTTGGFFYVLPQEIAKLYERERDLQDLLALEIAKLCARLSDIARKELAFLRFLDKRFELCDGLFGRCAFARAYNLSFVQVNSQPRTKSSTQTKAHAHMVDSAPFILREFCHPRLRAPVPVSVDFTAKLLMLTGVNAGGKTMLLKSLLSAAFLAKYLIPMKINAHKSAIPYYKHIYAIISNPQSSKNDISTFAGRIVEFREQLGRDELLLGIDEIELGTDADEAASLYKTLLEILLDRSNKIIITTHHKRLAALMARDSRVQLSAAMFDLQRYEATFTFLHGSIGKSYAFESAERYGIPKHIIQQARIHYGDDKERLNTLIEKSINLELELESKKASLEAQIARAQKTQESYAQKILDLETRYAKKVRELESTYHEAQSALKQQAKTLQDIHRNLNRAHAIIEPLRQSRSAFGIKASMQDSGTNTAVSKNTQDTSKNKANIKRGDVISYKSQRAVITQLDSRSALLELESGMRLRVKRVEIERASRLPALPESRDSSVKSSGAKGSGIRSLARTKLLTSAKSTSPTLDLHGLRAEEAQELVQNFISDSLLAGFDEVLIYHGIGTGVLSRVVAEILRTHPSVVSFADAPAHMGGMGAKLVRL